MAEEESDNSIIAKASDLAFDFMTGTSIPAPVRRNFFKVVGQLFTGLADVPAAYLEGIAKERRAIIDARVKMISSTSDQITEKIDVSPEYAKAALRKYGEKIVGERINIDKVINVAAQSLKEDFESGKLNPPPPEESATDPTQPETEINEDWINAFEEEVASKSTEEMQQLFGRILAGEIQQPKSFSIKTLKLVGELDSTVAELFRKFCSIAMFIKVPILNTIYDARVNSLGGDATKNSLIKFGLGFGQLNILQEYGLIISDYNSYMDYQVSNMNENSEVQIPFCYQNKYYAVVPMSERAKGISLRIQGAALTRVGRELSKIVDIKPNNAYTDDLKTFFEQKQLKIVKVEIT